jgi:pyruvate dehydrogenase E2 component (dihydrolipoamide acetyltransferase)
MPTAILMPALSPTMEEGKLAKWLVKEGQLVKPGDVIAEIETDKATMEVEATDEGQLGQILVAEGTEGVKVNTPIATLLEEGESAGVSTDGAQQSPPKAAAPRPLPSSPSSPPAPARSAEGAGDAAAARQVPARANGERVFASPLARRLAAAGGLSLSALSGSGPHGRIIKRDVEAALKATAPGAGARSAGSARVGAGMGVAPRGAGLPAPSPAAPMADDKVLALFEKSSYELVPHDGMRKIIAQRLTLSKTTIPHFYLTVDCRIDELLAARQRLNAASPKDGPRAFRLTVNDFFIKALALALTQVPAANVTWTEAGTLRHKYSDVGVAVAIEGGLFTPIIRHAELKSLSEISNEMRDLAERARKRRLLPHEYQGGTTSISNLGMYAIKSFEAVINPPHATILAVGAGEKRPVVTGDQVAIATIMAATLSCDHRVVDGAIGAELLNAFKTLIEDPVRMLI